MVGEKGGEGRRMGCVGGRKNMWNREGLQGSPRDELGSRSSRLYMSSGPVLNMATEARDLQEAEWWEITSQLNALL